MAAGRDGKIYQRDVTADVSSMRSFGITLVVCLISEVEVRSIGCNFKKYEIECLKQGIELF